MQQIKTLTPTLHCSSHACNTQAHQSVLQDSQDFIYFTNKDNIDLIKNILKKNITSTMLVFNKEHPLVKNFINKRKDIINTQGFTQCATNSLDIYNKTEKKLSLHTFKEWLQTTSITSQKQEIIHVICQELLLNAAMAAPELKDKKRNADFNFSQPITLSWAISHDFFVLGVKDPFGLLSCQKFLAHCFGLSQNTSQHGAGIGLQFIFSRCSYLAVNLIPHVSTEVTCFIPIECMQNKIQYLGLDFITHTPT